MGLYNDDLCFIHIPKTAGKSVKAWLLENVPGTRTAAHADFKLAPEQVDKRLPIGHVPLKDIERFTGRTPDSFRLILAIVREPHAQQLSQWLYWRDRYARGGRHVHDVIAASYATLTGALLDHRFDFHLWYESVYGSQKVFYETNQHYGFAGYTLFGGYYRYWLDVEGRIPPNVRIVRLEELDEALPAVLHEFEVAGDLPPIPKLNVTLGPRGTEVQAYYTPMACKIVEHKFRWTFDMGLYPRWDTMLQSPSAVVV